MIVELEQAVTVSPCPLCGSESFLKTNNAPEPKFWVKCGNPHCGCTTIAVPTQEEALGMWNRRALRVG